MSRTEVKLYTVITSTRVNSVFHDRFVETTRIEVPIDTKDLFSYIEQNYPINAGDIIFMFYGWPEHV